MSGIEKSGNDIVVSIRWAVRILAGYLVVLVIVLFIGGILSGEGPGNPFKHPLEVQLGFVGMFAMWVGCIIGWKREGFGGLLVIGGMMIFHVVNRKFWLNGTFALFDLVGVLYLLYWWLKRPQKLAA